MNLVFISLRIYSRDCGTHLMFVCRNEDRYTFVNETKTWPVASDYCKTLDGNLASFSSSDMDEIFTEFDFPIWIGLRKGGNNQRCNLLRFFSDNSDIVDMKSDLLSPHTAKYFSEDTDFKDVINILSCKCFWKLSEKSDVEWEKIQSAQTFLKKLIGK